MTAIYILVVKGPPSKEHGCRSCQFEDDFSCDVSDGEWIGHLREDGNIPEWCPLQRVELEGK
jgi:hypothetical protein